MNKKLIRLVSSAAAAMALSAGAIAAPDPNFHIYLLLGQSNMQGAAHQLPQPYTHERVRVLQSENCSGISTPYGQWRDHFHPVIKCDTGTRPNKDTGRDDPIGLGPGDSFGVTMAEEMGPGVTIGLVGAAFGGTDIKYHVKNCAQLGACATPSWGSTAGAPNNGDSGAYVWALELAKKAQEVGVIKGILMHHGENNAGDQAWLGHVKSLVNDLRADLNLSADEVPFIAGELGRFSGSGWAAHNPIIQRVDDAPSQGGVENGHWVSSENLDHRGDNLHFGSQGVIELGKRYAAKMLEVGTFGPVDCDVTPDGTPICCNISADPDGDGWGEQNDGQQCKVTPETVGWHPPNPSDVVVAINVGSTTDALPYGDIYFDADEFFTGGQPNRTEDPIADAQGSEVFSSERYGEYGYQIPIASGQYSVELGFVEIYQNNPDLRLFNVSVEGNQVISNLDIFEQVGHDALYTETFDVSVSDGQLDIQLTTVMDNATLSSIVVRTKAPVASSSSSVASSAPASSSSSVVSSSSAASSSSAPSTPAPRAGSLGLLTVLLVSLGLSASSLRRKRRA